ncbi:MAG: hypothetical protein IT492_07450 [Gammaproteobacteria bacterium]|nr:hypothetical protein [Gammaproteobacteria bacterium]
MRSGTHSEGWNDLVEELKQLESFFPLLGSDNERDELEEEVQELEELIAAAGEPEDEHSLRALTFLQTELARKRAMLDYIF